MKEKKDISKDMLLEMMHKVGGMPLNENYPMGAEPEHAGDDAPYNQNDDDYEDNEPDPDMYRDDDLDENANLNSIKHNIADSVFKTIENQIPEEIYTQISSNSETFFKFYDEILDVVKNIVSEKYADSFNTKAGAAPDEM